MNDTVTNMDSDSVVWFGLYPSYAACILNCERNSFSVLCSEKLNYTDYILKCIDGKECTFNLQNTILNWLQNTIFS
jgi:hypothetical protein